MFLGFVGELARLGSGEEFGGGCFLLRFGMSDLQLNGESFRPITEACMGSNEVVH